MAKYKFSKEQLAERDEIVAKIDALRERCRVHYDEAERLSEQAQDHFEKAQALMDDAYDMTAEYRDRVVGEMEDFVSDAVADKEAWEFGCPECPTPDMPELPDVADALEQFDHFIAEFKDLPTPGRRRAKS